MGNRGPSTHGAAQKPATIQDVAARAEVSIATVSRVLNGADTVDRALAERVRAAMHELRYQPSRAARTLAGRHSTIIGLIVVDMQNPFYMEVIRGVEDLAQSKGFLVVLCNSAENPRRERQYVEVLCAEPVAGAILVPSTDRTSAVRLFAERGIPVVGIDRRVRDGSVDSVLIDNVAAAREAVAHLLAGGYRRIGLIGGPTGATTARERRDGYRLALQDAGLAPDAHLERIGPHTEESARRLAGELLDLEPSIDAFFTGNNRLTMGVLQALHARHLRVPDDVGLAGFDEVPWTPPGAISLTTIIQPAYELGQAATARLFERLSHAGAMARREIVLAYQFRVGDSSRAKTFASAPAVG